jgi:hypothetical protein
MKQDTFYFPHDFNTRNDIKIKKLISKHGYLGYGIFWAIVEDLYNNANAMPTDYDCIAYDMRVDISLVESIVKDFALFVFDDGKFGSLSIQKRLDDRNEISNKARISANKRWNNANAMPTHSEGNAKSENRNAIKERKGKENKVKENKVKEIKEEKVFAGYSTCMDIYNKFILKKTGATAKIDGLQGKALKEIINYLSSQEKIAGVPEKIIEAWQYILNNHDKTDNFLQGQIKLSQINSNITNILSQIKNGHQQSNSTAEFHKRRLDDQLRDLVNGS